MTMIRRIITYSCAVFAAMSEAAENDCATTPLLHINRDRRSVNLPSRLDAFPRRWIKRGAKLFEARYRVPQGFLGEPVENGKQRSGKAILENAGIKFGEGASASFDSKKSELVLINDPEQLELADAYFSVGGCFGSIHRTVATRVEIFEIPSIRILDLLESAFPEGNHTPERDALIQYVKEGHGRLVATPSVRCDSGHQGTVKDITEVLVPSDITVSDPKPENKGVFLESKDVGTILTVEPTIGTDSHTLNLTITLEHHTAPPTLTLATEKLQVPSFHVKKLETFIEMESGEYVLAGTWSSTHDDKPEAIDLAYVIFVTANIQPVGDYGQKEAVSH